MLRAFSNKLYDYYELTENFKIDPDTTIPKGSIFVHDKKYQSIDIPTKGVLRLCWTPEGESYCNIGGGRLNLPICFIDKPIFKLVQKASTQVDINLIENKITEIESLMHRANMALNEAKNLLKTLIP